MGARNGGGGSTEDIISKLDAKSVLNEARSEVAPRLMLYLDEHAIGLGL